MAAAQSFVIIGASLAGAKAAETLREEGFDGAVVLIGEEAERPYERPPLSKGYLLGSYDREAIYVHPSDWYAQNDVDLRTGTRAMAIDTDAKQVRLDHGESIGYDRLLLATGASPRRLPVAGADLDGVLYLRTVGDSDKLRSVFRDGAKVVIAGAGWIGMETAAAARQSGCEVTIVEPAPAPLYASVGPELAAVFERLHRNHGVNFRFGEGVTELRGEGGAVRQVVTSEGSELPADVVIIAIGVVPNVALAADAGLQTENGIMTDLSLRTSDPDVFAAGDAANAFNTALGRSIRVEHWGNALASGPIAARAMLGQDASYDWIPYFFSDQYDLGMEAAGVPEPGHYDRVIYRGEKDEMEFIAFWLRGDVVVAGMNVNVWDVNDDIQALIRAGTPVDVARLTDPAVPLSELTPT